MNFVFFSPIVSTICKDYFPFHKVLSLKSSSSYVLKEFVVIGQCANESYISKNCLTLQNQYHHLLYCHYNLHYLSHRLHCLLNLFWIWTPFSFKFHFLMSIVSHEMAFFATNIIEMKLKLLVIWILFLWSFLRCFVFRLGIDALFFHSLSKNNLSIYHRH